MENTATGTETAPKTASSPSKSKRNLIIAGVVILVLALAIGAGMLAINLLNKAASPLAINPQDPQGTVNKINETFITAVEAVDPSNPEKTLENYLKNLGVSAAALPANQVVELTMAYNVASEAQDMVMDFNMTGLVKVDANNKPQVDMSGTFKIEQADIKLSVPMQILFVDNTAYLKTGDIDTTGAENDMTVSLLAGMLEQKWIKFDIAEATQLSQASGVNATNFTQKDKDELLALWKKTPPLKNGKAAADRKVGDATIPCITADMDSRAFATSGTASQTTTDLPIEICSGSYLNSPVYFGATLPESTGVTGKVSVSAGLSSKTLDVKAPAGAQTLEELFRF